MIVQSRQIVGTVDEVIKHKTRNFTGRVVIINSSGKVLETVMFNRNTCHGYMTMFCPQTGRIVEKCIFDNGKLVRKISYPVA